METPVQDPDDRPPPHKEDVRRLLLEAYYENFNADPGFAEELTNLFRTVRKAKRPMTSIAKALQLTPSEIALSAMLRKQGLPHLAEGSPAPKSERLAELFRDFAVRWSLPERAHHLHPREGVPDLVHSNSMWGARSKRPARLIVGPSIIGTAYGVGPRRISIPGVSFDFDSSIHSKRWAKKRLEQAVAKLREDGSRQIEDAWRPAAAADWLEAIAARYRTPEERKALARRLYLRVVQRTRYRQIALREHVTEKAVKKSVAQLASTLGVTLPRDKGRPRRPR